MGSILGNEIFKPYDLGYYQVDLTIEWEESIYSNLNFCSLTGFLRSYKTFENSNNQVSVIDKNITCGSSKEKSLNTFKSKKEVEKLRK